MAWGITIHVPHAYYYSFLVLVFTLQYIPARRVIEHTMYFQKQNEMRYHSVFFIVDSIAKVEQRRSAWDTWLCCVI